MSRCSCPDLECACCFQDSTTIEVVSGDGEPGNCLAVGVKEGSCDVGATNLLTACSDGMAVCISATGNVTASPVAGACPTYELNYAGGTGVGAVVGGCGISASVAGPTTTVGLQVGNGLCDGDLYCDADGSLKGPPPAISSNYEQPLGATATVNPAGAPVGVATTFTSYGTVALVTSQSFCKGSTVYLSGGGRQRLFHNQTTDTAGNVAFQYLGINGGALEPHRYEAWAKAGANFSSAWSMGPRGRIGTVPGGGNVTIQESNVYLADGANATSIVFWNPGGWAIHIDSTNNLA